MGDLHSHASEVVISLTALDQFGVREQYKKGLLPHNVRTTPFPQAINGSVVTFTDGETLEPDVIIFCTGYEYSFPFLDASCDVTVSEGKRIQPLFKHMIHSRYHTLMFIDMVYTPIEFSIAYIQVSFAFKILDGSLALPSEEEMIQETEADYRDRMASGQKTHHAHSYEFALRWTPYAYCDEIVAFAGIEHLVAETFGFVMGVFARLFENVMTFRDHDFLDPIPDQ
ncbi:PREDICTED: flavin-containing monooxygenase FMO GS-OX-like 9 [Priapulus caudatus]|uniref:Flavin-containing monooxygenase n=1 Tax=Priapulus caudatus TaxID=37621 RepID=A0ABM1EHG0_PRICU|nr:PREDICTED: flavin-containing monooxygenase FMO GS-OX-like 9 [Priapulus caudatus]